MVKSVTGGQHVLDFIGSVCMKKLCAPVTGIEQPEEYDTYHGHEQQAATMLGQGETGKS
jgi:hypothetical protein